MTYCDILRDEEDSWVYYIRDEVSLEDALSEASIDLEDCEEPPSVHTTWMRRVEHEDYDEFWEQCGSKQEGAELWTVLEAAT